jgi:hypothetical protein
MELKKFLLILIVSVTSSNSLDLIANFSTEDLVVDDLVVDEQLLADLQAPAPSKKTHKSHNEPIINRNREYRKIERKIERDLDNDEVIACEIEDNSCLPNDGESLGDSTKCCSGYANSRNICEGRQ